MSTVNDWIRRETSKHTELLSKIRERLELALEPRTEYDADGRPQVIPADVEPGGTPNRDWCRAFQRYQTGYATVLQEQREQTKLSMLAKASGMKTLTDEEFEREMLTLGREAVKELSDRDLEEELRRRGILLLPKVPE